MPRDTGEKKGGAADLVENIRLHFVVDVLPNKMDVVSIARHYPMHDRLETNFVFSLSYCR